MASTIKVDKIEGSTGSTITVPTGQTFTVTDGIAVSGGGTGLTGFTAGDVLYATGTTTLAKLAKGTAEQVLAMNSGATAPDWGSVDLTVLPTITVAKGGTNLTAFTAGDVLYATGATTLAKLAKGSAADVLTMNTGATAPEWAAAAGGGKLLQAVETVVTASSATTTSTSFVDIVGMSLAITPTAASSKILFTYGTSIGHSYSPIITRITRDIEGGGYSAIFVGDAVGSRSRVTHGTVEGGTADTKKMTTVVLDSPSYTLTDVITYKIQWLAESGSTSYLNRSSAYADNYYNMIAMSSMTAIEVGA